MKIKKNHLNIGGNKLKSIYKVCIMIFVLVNVYFPYFKKAPIDVAYNLFFFALLIINNKEIRFKKAYIVLVFIIGISLSITALINMNIYYIFIFVRNVLFLSTIYILYCTEDKVQLNKLIILCLWINNIFIVLKLLNVEQVQVVEHLVFEYFGIGSRLDYRTNGIVDGPLKAGIISFYLFWFTQEFNLNKYIKLFLSVLLFFLMFLQARTAIIFASILILFKILFSSKLKFKRIFNKTIYFCSAIIIIVLLFKPLIQFYPSVENTIIWQKNELFNLRESKTISILLVDTGSNEINRVYNAYKSNLKYLFGIGTGSWNESDSLMIQSDNGYIALLLGSGLIGVTLLILGYLYLFSSSYNNIKKEKLKRNNIIILFITHFILNVKTTTLTNYHYFNLFFLAYFILIFSGYKTFYIKED